MTSDGTAAGSSPGRGVMDTEEPLRANRAHPDVPGQPTQAPLFESDGTCNRMGCNRSTHFGSDYCLQHMTQRNPFQREPSRDFDIDGNDLVPNPTVGDDDQLDRIERKLDALLDHLGVEVDEE